MQKPQISIVFLLIAMAIILALGLFLAVAALQNRPTEELPIIDPAVATDGQEAFVGGQGNEPQVGASVVVVENIVVTLNTNPNRAVRLVGGELVTNLPIVEQAPITEDSQPNEQTNQETAVVEEPIQPTPTAETAVLTAPPPTEVPQTTGINNDGISKIIHIDYLVQPEDTLYSIAQRLDTSIALMADQGLDHNDLVPGTIIRLPIGNPEYCLGRRAYAVGEGDTAYSIGRRHGTTADELRAINDLDENYTVYAASIICIP